MTQKRLPPEDRREHFETKIRLQPNGCWHWHFPSRPTTAFSWTEEAAPGLRRINFALNIRKTSWHYAGHAFAKGHCIVVKCGDPRCINPDHLEQVTYSAARMRWPEELRQKGGKSRKNYIKFTDDQLREIWTNPLGLGGKELGAKFGCCCGIIWNVQRGVRDRAEIERLFGPQQHWGRDRDRKYDYAEKNSTRNTRTTQRLRSVKGS